MTIWKTNVWWFYALLSAFFAALTALLAKVGIKGVDSDLATAVRTIVILIIAWSIVLLKGGAKGIPTLSKSNVLFLCLSGVATGLSWIFYFRALQIGKVSQVASIDRTSLVFATILAFIFLGETISWTTAVGSALIITGAILVVL